MKINLKNVKTKQIIFLYLVNIIGIPLGIVTNLILTKYLGAKLFGDYSYLNGIFNLAIVVFNFGTLYAANRALVINKDEENAKEIYGASLILTAVVFLMMSVCLIFYGLIDDNINKKGLMMTFLYLIPFGSLYLLTNYFEILFQADNKIKLLGFIRLYPKIGFFFCCLFIFFFLKNYDLNRLLIAYIFYLGSFIVVYLIAIIKVKPSFKNLKENIKSLYAYTKSYGFDVYIGAVFAVGASNLSGILISHYDPNNSNVGVGFYNLAITFTMPLSFIPNIIATTHFKEFAELNRIPAKLFKTTILLSLSSLVILWLIIDPFISFFYSSQFKPVIALTMLISIGITAHGMADFFNRFLGAHGKGKLLRNSSFIVGIALITTSLTLIPIWHEKGAVFARVVSGLIYLINMLYLYIKTTNNKQKVEI